MKNERRHTGMWEYLDSLGVLNTGNEEEIKRAKREYRKKYLFHYKRKQRQNNSEFIISFSKPKGEHKKIIDAAKAHHSSPTKFIKDAALAYLEKKYLVPNKEAVANLEYILSDCRNEIRKLSRNRIMPVQEQIFSIEKRIDEMESGIGELFRNPPLQ